MPQRSPSPISKVDQDFDLMGYALPPGTIVSTQAWSMHRDTELFPSPETFLPERWLAIYNSEAEMNRLTRYALRYILLMAAVNRRSTACPNTLWPLAQAHGFAEVKTSRI